MVHFDAHVDHACAHDYLESFVRGDELGRRVGVQEVEQGLAGEQYQEGTEEAGVL